MCSGDDFRNRKKDNDEDQKICKLIGKVASNNRHDTQIAREDDYEYLQHLSRESERKAKESQQEDAEILKKFNVGLLETQKAEQFPQQRVQRQDPH